MSTTPFDAEPLSEQPVQRDELISLLELGMRAPSGDNAQPWKFVVRPGEVEVWFDAPRARAILDVAELGSRLALGALLESLSLAGSPRGVKAEWILDPDPTRPTLWAMVRFTRAPTLVEPLAASLSERHTNRGQFETTPLSAEDEAALVAEAVPGTQLRLLSDRQKIETLADLVAAADRIRMKNARAHRELYSWLRWSKAAAEATRDGLDVRTLSATAGTLFALRALTPWPVARLAYRVGAAHLAGDFARKQVLQCGAVGLITCAALTPALATEAGRSLLRVWVRVTQRRLALCPHAALPLLVLRAEVLDDAAFDGRAVEQIRAITPVFRALFGAAPSEQPLILFRVGQAPPIATRSLRRDVSDLVQASP